MSQDTPKGDCGHQSMFTGLQKELRDLGSGLETPRYRLPTASPAQAAVCPVSVVLSGVAVRVTGARQPDRPDPVVGFVQIFAQQIHHLQANIAMLMQEME